MCPQVGIKAVSSVPSCMLPALLMAHKWARRLLPSWCRQVSKAQRGSSFLSLLEYVFLALSHDVRNHLVCKFLPVEAIMSLKQSYKLHFSPLPPPPLSLLSSPFSSLPPPPLFLSSLPLPPPFFLLSSLLLYFQTQSCYIAQASPALAV